MRHSTVDPAARSRAGTRRALGRRAGRRAEWRPTMADIALQAGVSTATVSRVVNSPAQVAVCTRERVQAAIAGSGWAPNPAARTLARGHTAVVALVVRDMANLCAFHAEADASLLAELGAELAERRAGMIICLAGEEELVDEVIQLAGVVQPTAVILLGNTPQPLDPRYVETTSACQIFWGDQLRRTRGWHRVVDSTSSGVARILERVDASIGA